MNRIPIWAIVLVVAAGCSKAPGKPAEVATQTDLKEVPSMSAYALGNPIETGNLTVVPVVYKSPAPQGDEEYATLAEAMKHGWVEIIEKPGGQVDTLLVRNNGPKPLLLLGGELLIGGKQDRVVCKDVIVPAGKTIEVAVNCVEHGRWTDGTVKFESAGTMVPMRVRKEAGYGSQQGVWDRVSEYNAEAKADTAKTTIQAGLANDEVQKKLTIDVTEIVNALKARKGVVGIIIAYDGVPQTLEIFGTPALFTASQESILKSALSEVALRSSRQAKAPAMSEFEKFFVDCMNAPRKLKSQDNDVNSFSASTPAFNGAEIATSDYEAKPAAKKDGLVHGTYSRNADR